MQMKLPGDFEELTHGGKPAIPSIVDVLPLLEIEKTIDLEGLIKIQYKNITETFPDLKIKEITAKKGFSFLIPLTAYLPLPTPYQASLVLKREEQTNTATGFTCVTIDSYNPILTLDSNDILLQLSFAVVTLASNEFNDLDHELQNVPGLHKIYDRALSALNSVINAYKITPGRHSHLLQAQSALSAPGFIHIAQSNFPDAEVVKKETIGLHDHLIGELWQSRMVSNYELKNFGSIHAVDGNGGSFPLWLVTKLNEAIDARCHGKDDSAIIFADHYVELSMRFLLYQILLSKGSTHIDARARARNHTKLDNLVKDLSTELGQSPTNFKNNIAYSAWIASCRKKRNILNHEIERSKITPNESFKAVDSSATIIKKICEIINSQYPSAIVDTQWLMSAAWMTESLKQAKSLKRQPNKANHSATPRR